MKTKIELKKAKAIEYLKMMDICQDYIDIFQEKGVVTYWRTNGVRCDEPTSPGPRRSPAQILPLCR